MKKHTVYAFEMFLTSGVGSFDISITRPVIRIDGDYIDLAKDDRIKILGFAK